MRFGLNATEKGTKNKEHLVIAINVLLAAISGAVFPGVGAVAGLLTTIAGPLAGKIFGAEDHSGDVVALGAVIEDYVMANPGGVVIPSEFVYQFEKTMRHCGFPY